LNKEVAGRRYFRVLESVSRLVCPSLGDVGKLQKLQNFKTLIRKRLKL